MQCPPWPSLKFAVPFPDPPALCPGFSLWCLVLCGVLDGHLHKPRADPGVCFADHSHSGTFISKEVNEMRFGGALKRARRLVSSEQRKSLGCLVSALRGAASLVQVLGLFSLREALSFCSSYLTEHINSE